MNSMTRERPLATLNVNMHLVKKMFARGRKMKAFAELRAMVEVWSTPPGLGRRVYKRSSSRCVGFDAAVPISGKIVPRTRLGWVPGGIPSVVKAGIDRT